MVSLFGLNWKRQDLTQCGETWCLQVAGAGALKERRTSHNIADAAAASAVQNAQGNNRSFLCYADGAADRGGGNVRAVAVTIARICVICTARKVPPGLPAAHLIEKNDGVIQNMPDLRMLVPCSALHCLCYNTRHPDVPSEQQRNASTSYKCTQQLSNKTSSLPEVWVGDACTVIMGSLLSGCG